MAVSNAASGAVGVAVAAARPIPRGERGLEGGDPTQIASAGLSGVKGLYHQAPDGISQFPLTYDLVDRLLPGTCPAQIRLQRVPFSDQRTDGVAWVSATERTIYFMTDDVEFYKSPGIEATLFSLAAKVCLGQVTRQGEIILSREEKGLRFLEDGFAQYLQTRPEVAALGGRPEASRNFLEFAAKIELLHRFGLEDFWPRLPDAKEIADRRVQLNPRRIEAQFVAGAFVRDLIDEQGLGLEGYMELWQKIAANPYTLDAAGHAIPEAAVVPVLSGFLAQVSGGRIPDLQTAWKNFTGRLLARNFSRPTVELRANGDQIEVSFSRDMLADKADVTLDNVQIGAERMAGGVGSWRDARTLVLSMPAVRDQLGLDHVFTVQVNWGRIWQWFRARDGIPAEGGRLELSAQ